MISSEMVKDRVIRISNVLISEGVMRTIRKEDNVKIYSLKLQERMEYFKYTILGTNIVLALKPIRTKISFKVGNVIVSQPDFMVVLAEALLMMEEQNVHYYVYTKEVIDKMEHDVIIR